MQELQILFCFIILLCKCKELTAPSGLPVYPIYWNLIIHVLHSFNANLLFFFNASVPLCVAEWVKKDVFNYSFGENK